MSELLTMFVALPLLMAAVLTVVRHRVFTRVFLVAVPAASSVAGFALLGWHQSTPVYAHTVGAYLPGIGIVFASDSLSALLIGVIGLLTAVSAAFLGISGEYRYRFVPTLVLMVLSGANGALLTGDLFNLFVFIEVMLLPSYALIAVTGAWRRLGVGRMFVIVNLLASTIFVLGVGLVYGAAGTVNLAGLARAAEDSPQVSLAVGVTIFAMLVKAGAVPVHGWLPRAYPATSAGVMALFSAIHTKVGLYAVFRIYATVYEGEAPWTPVLIAVAIATVLVGSIATFGQKRIRAALSYQMVAGVGQILIGLVVFLPLSLTAGIYYMVHHMITMGALILASGALETVYGTGRYDRLGGLMRREPVVATVMALGFLSLVGLPPTSGLWGKVALLGGAAQYEGPVRWVLLGVVAGASIASLMALQYLWRQVFQGKPMETYLPDDPLNSRGDPKPVDDSVRTTWRLTWPATFLMGISVAMFFGSGLLWPHIERASATLSDIGRYLEAVSGS